MSHPIYHLDMRVTKCVVTFSVNDMPLGELSSQGPNAESFAPPMNPYLVGSSNMLQIEVIPVVGLDLEHVDLGEAQIEVAIVRAMKGDPVAPGEGDQVAVYSFGDELRARIAQAKEDEEELELPQRFFEIFDNEAVDFASEVRDGEPFDDEAALRDYAVVIRDLVASSNAAGLAAEMEPKVQAYATAYAEDGALIRASLVESLTAEIFPAGCVTDFTRDEVQLEPLCGGRIWEIRRPNGRPLVSSDPGEDGGSFQIPILVAPRDGVLKVVR